MMFLEHVTHHLVTILQYTCTMLVLHLNMLPFPLQKDFSECISVWGIFKPNIIFPWEWKNAHMYVTTSSHASLQIKETISEDAVTLRIDLSPVKIISVRGLRFRESLDCKHMDCHLCVGLRDFIMFYMPDINLTNSQILYHTFL